LFERVTRGLQLTIGCKFKFLAYVMKAIRFKFKYRIQFRFVKRICGVDLRLSLFGI